MHPTQQQECVPVQGCTKNGPVAQPAVAGTDTGKDAGKDGDIKDDEKTTERWEKNTLNVEQQSRRRDTRKVVSPVPQPAPPLQSRHTSILKPGAIFSGYQESGRQRYEVQVKLLEVDLNSSTLSGFLTIHNLTDAHPLMVTFFKGEVVGPHFSFETRHPSWESSLRNDIQHWARFTPWRKLDIDISNDAENNSYYQHRALQHEYLFMRWKELFLYPDSNISGVKGASFAGFYYLSLNQVSGNITGLYFHRSSDMFQQLNLSFVPDAGVSATYEYA